MARRSHQETFILLRNNSLKNRSFYKNISRDDERAKLVDGFEDSQDDIELNTSERQSYGQNLPSWLSSLDEFRYDAFNVTQKIEQLRQLQDEHLKQQNTAIFASESSAEKLRSIEQQIDRKCKELSSLFTRLHSILTHFKTLKSYPTTKSRLMSNVLRNIFQYQVQEVVRLTQLFRSCQRIYLERRSEATKVDREFVITFDEDSLFDELNNFGDSSYSHDSHKKVQLINNESQSMFFDNSPSENGFLDQSHVPPQRTQAQILSDSTINEHLKQRQKDMDAIMKSFAELNQMFSEVANFVVENGSALDRIDFQIESVQDTVALGEVTLRQASRKAATARKIKFILGSGVLVFMLFLLIVLRS